MKTLKLFVVTSICILGSTFAQASQVNMTYPGDPSCHCCTKCDDKKCQETCAEMDKTTDAKEAKKLAKKCKSHCKTAQCDTKKESKKSCCTTH